MYDRHGVRLSLIHALPVVAERHGARLGLVLARGGLARDEVDWDGQVVTRAQVCTMMQGLARMTGDATIGFQMAASTDVRRLGPFGAAVSLGRTLREGLTMQKRQMPWLQRGVQVSIATDGKRARWVHRIHDSDPMQARFLNEGIAAFIVQFVRAVAGDADARLHVTLPHRPLVPLRLYEDMLGCAVAFLPGRDLVIHFDASLLDRPNALRAPAGDRLWSAALTPEAENVPRDVLPDGPDLLQSLQVQIAAAAMLGKISVVDSCATLGLSPRSLQRRLAEMDTTFEGLVDDWRHRTAVVLLADPQARVAGIAAQLGYTDASHFVRAFHRWEGTTPSDFRARHSS
ncbi:MAG: AraC family transcriptional regulator ligand-binding domain-containing protein [Gemmobacter sp.]